MYINTYTYTYSTALLVKCGEVDQLLSGVERGQCLRGITRRTRTARDKSQAHTAPPHLSWISPIKLITLALSPTSIDSRSLLMKSV